MSISNTGCKKRSTSLMKIKVKISLFILALLCIIAFLFLLNWHYKTESKNIVIGVYEYPPATIKDPLTGKYKGFEIELLKTICQNQKINFTFKEITFEEIFKAIPAGEIDMATTITILPKRQATLIFSWPCMETGLELAVRKNNNSIKDLKDLENKKIGAFQGTGEDFCKSLPGKRISAKVILFQHVDEMYDALKDYKIDAIINDYSTNHYYAKKNGYEIKPLNKLYTSEYVGFPLKKGNNSLRIKINQGLKHTIITGEYVRLRRKYD
jgi:ABC-type amino acid transport substrate-binding protein